MLRYFVVAAYASAKTGRRKRVEVFLFCPFRCVVCATRIISMRLSLFVFRMEQVGVDGQAITVPFGRNCVKVLHRGLVCSAGRRILCFEVTRIGCRLVARVVDFPIQMVSDPFQVYFRRIALKVRRLQFGPSARFSANFFHFFCWYESSSKGLAFRHFPVTRTNVIVITQVFITGPSIIRRRRVCT